MKKRLLMALCAVLLILCICPLSAQVSINNDNSTPDPSAGLDVKFSNKGFLPPRLTQVQRDAILSPAEGLMVICTDCGFHNPTCLSVFISGTWRLITCYCVPPFSPVTGTHAATPGTITWNWSAVVGAVGYKWNTSNNSATALDVGNLTTKLESGLTCNSAYTRYVWAYSDCGLSASTPLQKNTTTGAPGSPTAGTHLPSITQIVWNWNAVSGATGYKWNTVNNPTTATDLGNVLTKTESSLTCNTAYTRYIFAYNSCGTSGGAPISSTTLTSPPASPIAGTQVPSGTQIIWNWNTVSGATGYKWNTINNYATATDLGAATTKTETGLICLTGYSRYIWAYSACGISSSSTISSTTLSNPPGSPVAGTHTPSVTQIIWNWNAVTLATGYKWNTINDLASATDLGNVLTKTETGLTCNAPYTRYIWAYNTCGTSIVTNLTASTSPNPPGPPVAGTHIPSQTQIIWNWNPVSGASGYKWSATNNYATATNMGTATTKTETGLTCNTLYSRYVWAYGSCGVSTVLTMSQTTLACWICGQTITDSRDGKAYNTVQIGTQCWMAQNMNVGTRINVASVQTNNGVLEKYCNYDNEAICDVYGGLYLWGESVQYLNGASNTSSWNPVPSGNVQGICPTGWHVPKDAEWCTLAQFLDVSVNCTIIGVSGPTAGGKMKEAGLTHWASPNTGGTNSSGFTALPAGFSYPDPGGGSYNLNVFTAFWVATQGTELNAYTRDLTFETEALNRGYTTKESGFTVRCVKN